MQLWVTLTEHFLYARHSAEFMVILFHILMASGQTLSSSVYFFFLIQSSVKKVSVGNSAFRSPYLFIQEEQNRYRGNQPWHSRKAILKRDISKISEFHNKFWFIFG